jgi:hypothetical protein
MLADVAIIEARAKASRIPMLRVLQAANISYSTWTRWKRGAAPTLTTFRAVEAQLARLIAESEETKTNG